MIAILKKEEFTCIQLRGGGGREIYQQQNALLAYDNNQLTGSQNIDKKFEIFEGKIHEKRF